MGIARKNPGVRTNESKHLTLSAVTPATSCGTACSTGCRTLEDAEIVKL